ncbi:MAG: hypothetical protein NUV98_05910, partial [Candidatus Roizmanbacteria bacterium]|nr:hypothetical protein [Candidatus Roizmanbacteria bacterium]
MPVQNLIEFIVYIVPGFIALEIFRAAYPIRKQSEFVHLTWSFVYGVGIYVFVKWIDTFFHYILRSNS